MGVSCMPRAFPGSALGISNWLTHPSLFCPSGAWAIGPRVGAGWDCGENHYRSCSGGNGFPALCSECRIIRAGQVPRNCEEVGRADQCNTRSLCRRKALGSKRLLALVRRRKTIRISEKDTPRELRRSFLCVVLLNIPLELAELVNVDGTRVLSFRLAEKTHPVRADEDSVEFRLVILEGLGFEPQIGECLDNRFFQFRSLPVE